MCCCWLFCHYLFSKFVGAIRQRTLTNVDQDIPPCATTSHFKFFKTGHDCCYCDSLCRQAISCHDTYSVKRGYCCHGCEFLQQIYYVRYKDACDLRDKNWLVLPGRLALKRQCLNTLNYLSYISTKLVVNANFQLHFIWMITHFRTPLWRVFDNTGLPWSLPHAGHIQLLHNVVTFQLLL